MKLQKMLAGCLVLAMVLAGCGTKADQQAAPAIPSYENATQIVLSDNGITVDGAPVGTDPTAAVYTANDIIYYEAGKDFLYGEGTQQDAHTPEEAAAHTVVHISKAGTYSLSGKLSLGQIAVDLGENAKKDPSAVVTLVLNGVDITCQVAPAVIFYNVYECGSTDEATATKDVDTSAAGANVIIANDTVNNVTGSYVAKIYKPESLVLNGDNTKVLESKKLHKYDAAFYSKRSMNIYGDTGVLNIQAENEGLDSELHLTLNGGQINIVSGNDGINTNEDNISVTTINAGKLNIRVSGETGEGDGIDSNGWLVINGGTVIAQACASSADSGIDSDKGIHITGGTVIATGSMLDEIESGGQTYAVFSFAQKQQGGQTLTLKDAKGNATMEITPDNGYSILVFSSPSLEAGTYTLWSGSTQLAGSAGGAGGFGGMGGFGGGNFNPGQRPGSGDKPGQGGNRPEGTQRPEGVQIPEGIQLPEGAQLPGRGQATSGTDSSAPQMPEGNFDWSNIPQGDWGNMPEGGFDWSQMPQGDFDWSQMPQGGQGGQGGNRPGGNRPEGGDRGGATQSASSPEFVIQEGANRFSGITAYTAS